MEPIEAMEKLAELGMELSKAMEAMEVKSTSISLELVNDTRIYLAWGENQETLLTEVEEGYRKQILDDDDETPCVGDAID